MSYLVGLDSAVSCYSKERAHKACPTHGGLLCAAVPGHDGQAFQWYLPGCLAPHDIPTRDVLV